MKNIIKSIPDQLEEGLEFPTPALHRQYSRVAVFGMGGSSGAAQLLGGAAGIVPERFTVEMGYGRALSDPDTLMLAVSYSGDTEETLSAYSRAECDRAVVTTGGKLLEMAKSDGVTHIVVPAGPPPRGAVGWLMMGVAKVALAAGVLDEGFFGLIPGAVRHGRALRGGLASDESEAVSLANSLFRRLPLIIGTDITAPLAFRFRNQLAENAKALSIASALPDFDHNEICGVTHPKELVEKLWVVFLVEGGEGERMKFRVEATRELLRDSVMGATVLRGEGENRLQRYLSLLLITDYCSCSLARLTGEDPFDIARIDELKKRLAAQLPLDPDPPVG